MSVPDKGNIKVLKDEFLYCRLLLTCLLAANMTIFTLKLGLTVQTIFFLMCFLCSFASGKVIKLIV